jgi:trehalose 6-phosphate synthase/phosphatase
LSWKAEARRIVDEIARRTPGCVVEEKTAGIAWHHRTVDVELARDRLHELEGRLADLIGVHDLEVIHGAKVLELRTRGPSKALAVGRALALAPEGAAVIAVGDDRTDEDLFAALPPSALTIHVGHGASLAAFRLPDPGAVRRLLRSFVPRRTPA